MHNIKATLQGLNFHHHDVSSVLSEFCNFNTDIPTNTGASAAVCSRFQRGGCSDNNELILSCPPFTIDSNNRNRLPHIELLSSKEEPCSQLDNSSLHCSYYRQYFLKDSDKQHDNYLANDALLGPIAISILKEDPFFRVVFRSSDSRACVRGSVALPHCKKNEKVVQELFPFLSNVKQAEVGVRERLVRLDEQGVLLKRKVGILLCLPGQSTEEEFYNNETSTRNFEAFLQCFSQKIRLKGFKGYAGGLDVKDDTTGTHSHHTLFNNTYEIMFHVSTLLPYTNTNKRNQLPRKRHIGNDIVTIVYQEPGCGAFSPSMIRSNFQHCFIVVRGCGDGFRISTTQTSTISSFGPSLKKYYNKNELASFLLPKIINAETAAYRSGVFAAMANRTRYEYLKELWGGHCFEGGGGNNNGIIGRFSQLLKKPQQSPQITSPIANVNSNIPGALSWKLSEDSTVALSTHYLLIQEKTTRKTYKIDEFVAWELDSLKVVLYSDVMERVGVIFEDVSSAVGFSNFLGSLKPPVEKIKIHRHHSLGFHIQNNCLITDVERNSPAAMANILPNSFVLRINGIETFSLRPQEMIEMLKKSDVVDLVLIGPGGVGNFHPSFLQQQQQQYYSVIEEEEEEEDISYKFDLKY